MAHRKSPEHRGRIIRASIESTASPRQLWNAWADPKRLAQWFPDRAEGQAVEGGTLTWLFDRFGYALPYEVLSAVPGEHLVLTGMIPGRPRFYLEIDIASAGGMTTLTLTNSGFLDKTGWDDEYEGIVSGWTMALALLKLFAERYYDKTRAQFFAMRPASYEYDELLAHFRNAGKLQAWLTRDGGIGDPGDAYELVLGNGERVSGRVLAVTGWEVQLSWDEIGGALALKGFAMGQGRAVCVHGSSWDLSTARALELERQFGDALDRLAAALSADRVPL